VQIKFSHISEWTNTANKTLVDPGMGRLAAATADQKQGLVMAAKSSLPHTKG